MLNALNIWKAQKMSILKITHCKTSDMLATVASMWQGDAFIREGIKKA